MGRGLGQRSVREGTVDTAPSDILHIAEEWREQLARRIDAHGLRGYDPFDVKQHALLRAVQPYRWPRRASTVLCDLFPVTVRRLLRIAPSENPKAFSLVALGDLRRFEATGDAACLKRAHQHLQWLRDHAEAGYSGACWGYPFSVYAKGLHTPAGTPIGVVSAIAGQAFALADELTGDGGYLETVRSIAEFFLHDILRMKQDDGTICFGYAPTDSRRVHNANLHAAAHLWRAYRATGDRRYAEYAETALQFTLRRQRPDGSWPYGEWTVGEPFEQGLMDIVDHHHTGFVLRSLHGIHALAPSPDIKAALDSGYRFYADNLFNDDGMPVMINARYPVDIHACAEAILCPAVLSDLYPEALALSGRALEWAAENMRHPRTGMPYYRRYPFFASRLLCTRWGLAWMYFALSEFIGQEKRPEAGDRRL
jgi:hypothetical protein